MCVRVCVWLLSNVLRYFQTNVPILNGGSGRLWVAVKSSLLSDGVVVAVMVMLLLWWKHMEEEEAWEVVVEQPVALMMVVEG